MQFTILCFVLIGFAKIGNVKGASCVASDPDCSGVVNPCLNSGKCCIQDDKPVCDCAATGGYSGGFCHERPCVPSTEPCLNGGTCEDTNGSFFCKCLPQFNGPRCERAPCAGNPCVNGGTCVAYSTSYRCTCPTNPGGDLAFSGKNCELTPCVQNPCLNGGTCSVRRYGANYACTCPRNAEGEALFTGRHCEESNACLSGPCQNEAICAPTTAYDWGYKCYHTDPVLSTKWAGQNAHILSACATGTDSCKNGGTCYRRHYEYYKPDNYLCKCTTEWQCGRCERPNPCTQGLSTPVDQNAVALITPPGDLCLNGGTCLPYCPSTAGYRCKCPFGFRGTDCSIRYAKHAFCFGDPRCIGFDGSVTSYQGTCHTVLSKSCDDENWPAGIPTFQIIGDFVPCGRMSCVNATIIEINGQIIEIMSQTRVTVDGQDVGIPYSIQDPENPSGQPLLTIQINSLDPMNTIGIETSWGLYITHGRRRVDAYLSFELCEALDGKLCGLWGNADNNLANDNLGLQAQELYDSHIIRPPKPDGCYTTRPNLVKRQVSQAEGPLSLCADENATNYALEACSIINNRTGPFASCYGLNTQRSVMYSNCLEDICSDASFKCDNLEGYAKYCGKLTCFDDWRSIAGCPAMCPQGMTYSLSANINCIKTCFNLDPCPLNGSRIIYNATCNEGCICSDETVWDVKSATCIPPGECGTSDWSVPAYFGQECDPIEEESNPSQITCTAMNKEDALMLKECKQACKCAVSTAVQKDRKRKNKKKKPYTTGGVTKCLRSILKKKKSGRVMALIDPAEEGEEQLKKCNEACKCMVENKGKGKKYNGGLFNKCGSGKFVKLTKKNKKTVKVVKTKKAKRKKTKKVSKKVKVKKNKKTVKVVKRSEETQSEED